MSQTSEDYEKEFELIDALFPEAKFTICLKSSQMDEVISLEKQIVIEESLYCYCNGMLKKSNLYIIKNMEMTNKNVINELIRQGMNRDCNHRFLESIYKKTECHFDLHFGS